MRLEFVPRRPIDAACLLVSPGEDRRFYRLSNRTQHIWFDHEKQAQEFARAMLDGWVDNYHRRLPIWIPDADIEPGLWLYSNTVTVISNPGVTQNFTFDSTWSTTNLVEAIGGGGGGSGGPVGNGGGGGAGASYAAFLNLTGYAPNTTTSVHISPGGAGSTGSGQAAYGGKTWFGSASSASAPLVATGGFGGNGTSQGTPDGSSVGTTTHPGGNGGSADPAHRGAGGGAAGATGAGGNGFLNVPGAGGTGALQDGSVAGQGGPVGSPGLAYGGGGSGGNDPAHVGTKGAQGIFVASWTPAAGASGISALIITG